MPALEQNVKPMSSATIDLGNQDMLLLEPVRRALDLYPGVGGAQVVVTLRVSRSREDNAAQPFRIDAVMHVGDAQNQRMLCHIRGLYLVTPTVRGADVQLTGFATDEQLRVVDELRRGGDLWLNLRLSVSSVEQLLDGTPRRQISDPLPSSSEVIFDRAYERSRTADLRFDINAGEWVRQRERVDEATFIELLVPLTGGEDYAGAVAALREARALLRDNKLEPAINAARKAVEVVRAAQGTQPVFVEAIKKKPSQRSLDERWAAMVEDLWSTMSGASHADPVTADFLYSREDAAMLITSAAGMLARLARDRRP